jgi:hypothetical protein
MVAQIELPRLSIGLPVFNGENYLRAALESILAQTYCDFELIISDNASSDATESIAREFAARDPRVRYFRNPVNRGAAFNYNRTFELSRGELYKQAAHDDLIAPTFLERCVEALDRDPGVVLAYTRSSCVDENGALITPYEHVLELDQASPSERWLAYFRRFTDRTPERNRGSNPVCNPIFGVVRSAVYAKTPLVAPYLGSDKVLLAEFALHGKFFEVPEDLFTITCHRGASWATGNILDIAAWFDPASAKSLGAYLPRTRHLAEYAKAIERARLPLAEKARCYATLRLWLADEGKALLREQAAVALRLAGLRPWAQPTKPVTIPVKAGEIASASEKSLVEPAV